MLRFILRTLLIPLFALIANPAMAFEPVNQHYFSGVTMQGYDAVSYFTDGKPLKGIEAHSLEWNGATWLFASAANRARFAESPQAFAPQYGGYCSNQMSLGRLVNSDPEVWLMFQGKLYLFGHEAGRQRWLIETAGKVNDGNRHWQRYLTR